MKKCEHFAALHFGRVLQVSEFWNNKKIGEFFQNHAHVPDQFNQTNNAIENKIGPVKTNVGLTKKHKVGNI